MFLEHFDIRPILLHTDIESIIGFPLIPKYMTLNDHEWPFYVKFCFYVSTMSLRVCRFEDNCVQTNKDDSYYHLRRKSLGRSLVPGNIRFMQIFTGFPHYQMIVWLLTTTNFADDVFGTFRHKADIIIYRHRVHHRLSTDPKIHDLE